MVDLTTHILETCGGMAVGIHTVVVSNEQRGIPNTYLMLAEQFGMSRSSIHRIVRPMIDRGFITIKESGGGRNKKTVLTPVNCPASRTESPNTVPQTVSYTVSETVLQTVPETVSNPPTPPVGVNTPSQQPISERETVKTPIPPRPKTTPFREGFDEFYSAYPKHLGKDQAERAWARLKPGPELRAEIMTAVAVQSQTDEWRKEGGRYVPYPGSWLNSRRWTDEIRPSAPPPSNGIVHFESRADKTRAMAARLRAEGR